MIPVPVSSILRHKGNGVWSIAPEASVYQAISIMAEKGIGALPVVADGRLIGILSERDYARKVVLQSRSSKDTLVSEIMTTPVVSVSPSNTVEDCMRTMTLQRIRHLPVVDEGRILGIVSTALPLSRSCARPRPSNPSNANPKGSIDAV